jgi:DNA-binding NtrC family response regulator
MAAKPKNQWEDPTILGRDPTLLKILDLLPDIANSDASVVLQGESGTGKELMARRLHGLSARREQPFIALNCGAFPATLLDSELFGHERGAFNGDDERREGRLEQADGGTVFLDEISEMPLDMQVRLLRFLQEGEIQRVGGAAPTRVDVRVVAAANRDLESMVAAGTFREDLFYRLNVFVLHLPPLRAREEDILLLARHHLDDFCSRLNKSFDGFTPEAEAYLMKYTFPGNIRELRNIVHRAAIIAQGEKIDLPNLPGRLRRSVESGGKDKLSFDVPTTGAELKFAKEDAKRQVAERIEIAFLRRILSQTKGNVSAAAAQAKINRSQLHTMIKRCGINPDDFRGYNPLSDSWVGELPEEVRDQLRALRSPGRAPG